MAWTTSAGLVPLCCPAHERKRLALASTKRSALGERVFCERFLLHEVCLNLTPSYGRVRELLAQRMQQQYIAANPKHRLWTVKLTQVPFYRYHKTLFFIGQSNHCDACHKTIELHDKRHREIAMTIQRIHTIDRSADDNSMLVRRRKKIRKRDGSEDAGSADAEEIVEEDGSSEWNDTSTLQDEDVQTKSSAWDTGFNTLESKKAAKDQKKLAKNQIRFRIISPSELQHIQSVLHPDVVETSQKKAGDDQGLINNSTIESNIAFTPGCFRWGNIRQSGHSRKALKNQLASKAVREEENAILQAILQRFRVTGTPKNNSKERKNLHVKLTLAIKADLIAHENEQAETMQRMAGYWRYANRRTYNEMVRINLLWDWATGQKLPEIDEGEDNDAKDEEELSLGVTTLVTTPSTENSDELDFAGETHLLKAKHLEGQPPTSSDHEVAQLKAGEVRVPSTDNPLVTATNCQKEGMTKQGPHSPFSLQKDSRSLSRAIRGASPPIETSPRPLPHYYTDKSLVQKPSKTTPPVTKKLENAFGALKFEVPAPCEDPQLLQGDAPTKTRLGPKQQPQATGGSSEESFPALKSPNRASESAAVPKQIKVLNITAELPQPEKGRRGRTLKISASTPSGGNAWKNVGKVRGGKA